MNTTHPDIMQKTDRNPLNIGDICNMVNNVHLSDEIAVLETQFSASSPESFPLRIDALVIIIISKGHGRVGIDLQEYNVQPGTMILLQPKNYIHLTQFSDDLSVKVIACSRNIVHEILPKLTDALPLLLEHRASPVHQLTPDEIAGLSQYHVLIKEKLSQQPTKFLKQKMISILQAALYELIDIHMHHADHTDNLRTRKQEIMAKFIIEITEGFRENRQVAHYAKQLSITPKHLSAVVKEISGMTAGDWIDRFVIMESKVLLKTTDLSIQEIAARLNFANQGFFGKYFKHLTSLSPSEYRKSHESAPTTSN